MKSFIGALALTAATTEAVKQYSAAYNYGMGMPYGSAS